MKLDDYQAQIKKYDLGAQTSDLNAPDFMEKILGLAGETGEFCDKVKKILRDQNSEYDTTDRAELLKELGDVLWYVASIARYLDEPLSKVAAQNVEKLESRLKRNKLTGSGDNR